MCRVETKRQQVDGRTFGQPPGAIRLINAERLVAMKRGAVAVNGVRGEIVDDAALADAPARDHLCGVVLEVYAGAFEHPPQSVLQRGPRVLISPHISAAGDVDRHGGIGLFCDNLRACLRGDALRNVIDWQRGHQPPFQVSAKASRGRWMRPADRAGVRAGEDTAPMPCGAATRINPSSEAKTGDETDARLRATLQG